MMFLYCGGGFEPSAHVPEPPANEGPRANEGPFTEGMEAPE
uniref:Uncharacterized protein n=1 Tax=viral metagenome TaxID=1070528 RepID=A0A6C0DTI1_9ZZZZ